MKELSVAKGQHEVSLIKIERNFIDNIEKMYV